MILLFLKTTLVPCRGIYRMTYMSFLNGHQVMVLISMQKSQALEINFSRASTHHAHADLKIRSDKLRYVDKAKNPGTLAPKGPEMADPDECYAQKSKQTPSHA